MNSPSDTRPEDAFNADRAALEAEANGNAALPADAPAHAAPAAPGKTSAEVERDILAAPRKTPADEQREAIYAKAAANRGNVDDSEAAMRTGVEAMLHESAGTPVHEAPSAPLDSSENTITLRVEGREMQVSRADVERAGIAALQKETNADFRNQRVALAERAIAERTAALDARALEIEASRTATPTGASAPTANADLPSGGIDDAEGTKQALNALLDSDVDGAAKLLQKIVANSARAAAREEMGSHRPAAAPAAPIVSEADRVWPIEVRERVAQRVEAVFPQFRTDGPLRTKFHDRMLSEMANPVNLAGRVDLELLALSLGNDVLTTQPAPIAQPAANGVADELALRRTLAARMPAVPTSAQPRFVAPLDQGPAPATRSQTVLAMKKARGQA